MFKEGIIELALLEDIGSGDITTTAIVPENSTIKTELVAKEDFILAGLGIVKDIFSRFDAEAVMETSHTDGEHICKGEIIASISGKTAAIMSGERTALNFLQHLSGIASITSFYVQLLKPYNAQLVDTRKTTPGLRALEKYAVRCGGGQNHRLGLFGGILIKDNHIAVAGSISEAVRRTREKAPPGLRIEVETSSLNQVKEALGVQVDIIMLDNMDMETMQEAVNLIQGKAIVEVSGQVNLNTIEAIAQLGVDLISVGCITQSAKAVDISLQVCSS